MIHTPDLARGDQTARWMFYELQYVRREAQAEAQLAYEAWNRLPGRDGYAVYRAAQDRADAAQDELAAWVRGSQADSRQDDDLAPSVTWSRWVAGHPDGEDAAA